MLSTPLSLRKRVGLMRTKIRKKVRTARTARMTPTKVKLMKRSLRL